VASRTRHDSADEVPLEGGHTNSDAIQILDRKLLKIDIHLVPDT